MNSADNGNHWLLVNTIGRRSNGIRTVMKLTSVRRGERFVASVCIFTTNVRNLRALQGSSINSRLFILVASIRATAVFPSRSYEHTVTPEPAPPWPPRPPCAPVLPLTLFFSVSLWLCGEYLLVAAMLHCVYLWPNLLVCLP